MCTACLAALALALVGLSACDSPSPDEVIACSKQYAAEGSVTLSPQQQTARKACHDKALKFIDRADSMYPAAYQEVFGSLELAAIKDLDVWVSSGGKLEDVNTVVVPACGRLVTLYASPQERRGFDKKLRDEWLFRVDFCAKATVHQKYPQPEFENKAIVQQVCKPDGNRLWSIMCGRAGIAMTP